MNSLTTEDCAVFVARAQEELRVAETKHSAAVAERDRVASLISDCQNRHERLSRSGDRGMAALGELGLLQTDLVDLRMMLREAEEAVQATEPKRERALLADAEREERGVVNRIAYEQAVALAKRADAILVEAASQAIGAGFTAAGLQSTVAWRPSKELSNLVHYGRTK